MALAKAAGMAEGAATGLLYTPTSVTHTYVRKLPICCGEIYHQLEYLVTRLEWTNIFLRRFVSLQILLFYLYPFSQ